MIRVPYAFARDNQVLITEQGHVLHTCRTSYLALGEVARMQGGLEYRNIPEDEFRRVLQSQYETSGRNSTAIVEDLAEVDLTMLAASVPVSADLLDDEDNSPVIRLVNALFSEAIRLDASDIHIESFEKRLLVRFRIDGVLRDVVEPRQALAPMLVSRVKVMARLDIAEKRLPQDGRIALNLGEHAVDVRVSTLPGNNGERVVMRLLDKSVGRLTLQNLGMSDSLRSNWQDMLRHPNGILLVSGPTGSGKTTSLYASLDHIRDGQKNIMTIEDPVEYDLDGVGQTQVNVRSDMTFARGLRAILRQDPDVVMVGEIRDLETAEVAVQASLTGHLVLSTLHTNTAAGAITRLVDMGVEAFLLATTVNGVLAQRLVRLLCDRCKTPVTDGAIQLEQLGFQATGEVTLFQRQGCAECHQGYAGRQAIYHLLAITPELQNLIREGAGEHALDDCDDSGGLLASGLVLAANGRTSIEEVMRVAYTSGGGA